MKKVKSFLLICLFAAPSLDVFAYDYDISKDSNTRNGTLRKGKVLTGKIIQVRNVEIEPTQTAQRTGQIVGATVGAGVGSLINDNRYGTILGGVVGGVVGDVAVDKLRSPSAQEFIILLSNKTVVTYTQAQSKLKEGQNVYIVESNGKWRVIENKGTTEN